jgi:RNA:NAD 2'-phosphotransferase (TPT1/KptA family)
VLRHDAAKLGINIRKDGYCNLDEVLACKYIKNFNATIADIQAVVYDNDKQRFELIPNPKFPNLYLIRASQGHSMTKVKNDELLEPITDQFFEGTNVGQFK